MQSTTLLNGLQRENSAKDALIHQAKTEIEKLKKELREKDSTISSMSTKVRKHWTTTLLMLIDTKLLYRYGQHSDCMDRECIVLKRVSVGCAGGEVCHRGY